MSYTGFGAVRTWDGGEAVSIHGATAALGASIDGSVVPSFVDESARNTAATALIAAGKTGMTCYVQSRLGTCTFIGIPAGGAPPTNGWIWHSQNRLVAEAFTSGYVGGSTGNAAWTLLLALPSITLAGGQRLITVSYSAMLQPSLSTPTTALASASLILYVNGTPAAGEWPQAPMPVVAASLGGFYAQTLSRTAIAKTSGTQLFQLKFGQYTTGGGYIDAYSPHITFIDNGPID